MSQSPSNPLHPSLPAAGTLYTQSDRTSQAAANDADCPPILAGRDASEPSEIVVSVVRGYN